MKAENKTPCLRALMLVLSRNCVSLLLVGTALSTTNKTSVLVSRSKIKEGEVGWACSMHGRDEKCIKYVGWKT
jgi:hypothetical protein